MSGPPSGPHASESSCLVHHVSPLLPFVLEGNFTLNRMLVADPFTERSNSHSRREPQALSTDSETWTYREVERSL